MANVEACRVTSCMQWCTHSILGVDTDGSVGRGIDYKYLE